MKYIYELSNKFRQAIESALFNCEFLYNSCLSTFPRDCCDITCDLLGEYLYEHEIETFQINAQSKFDYQARHVWLVTVKDDIVIDITGDQFMGRVNYPKNIEAVYVGTESELHKIFSVDIKKEQNTIFTDPLLYNGFDRTPNARQKRLIEAYNIIKNYLK